MTKGRRAKEEFRCSVTGWRAILFGVVSIAVGLVGLTKNVNAQNLFTNMALLPSESLNEFSQNDILFYNPCDGGSGVRLSVVGKNCAKLAELRQAMWNNASEEDKKRFIHVVSKEDAGLAAVEGFMNQIIHRGKGLNEWLDNQCPKFMQHGEICGETKEFSDKEKSWVDKALGGSNITNVATGNAYGFSDAKVVGAVTCIWVQDTSLEDNGKCANVDYTKSLYSEYSGKSCSELVVEARNEDSSIPNSGEIECWGWDNTEKWSESIASQCGGNNSLGSTISTNTGTSTGSSSITWDEEGWITGGMDGYTKEPAGVSIGEYEHEKPNKIVLHYTQGDGGGLAAYGEGGAEKAAHFTIDLLGKKVWQHFPLSEPSGALAGKKGGPSDTYDNIQIEIVGYGFQKDTNPDNPGSDSKCIIDGKDETGSSHCFAKYGDAEWGYLAKLLKGINKWGKENGANIPLTSSVKWTGNTAKLRLSKSEYDNTVGIVGHMHVPHNDHDDPGNIWPMVNAALGGVECDLNGDENSISGAKNAEKQADEVGALTFDDNNNESMKKVLENYGDLAYRTGQAYGVPWVAIIVQGRYEDSGSQGFGNMCGKNNFWGLDCPPETPAGGGANYTSLGEGFKGYGKFTHNGNYEDALKETDPYEYLKKLGPMWVQGNKNGAGYGSIKAMGKSIEALTKYMETDEGKELVAQFGATGCDVGGRCSVENGDSGVSSGGSAILEAVQKIIDLANENGSNYVYGGGRSISNFKKVVNEGASNNIDCTGFASMVYWMVYGDEFEESDIFSSGSILAGEPSYREVSRSEVRPGDIFAYQGHGGIVVEVKDGKVTKIAETGGKEGRSGKNQNLGYSGKSDYSVRHMNGSAGHFYRWKGDNT